MTPSEKAFKKALSDIALLAEQRRKYDRDECCIRMGDIANKALYNRRGPGTADVCKGKMVPDCHDCKLFQSCCVFHSEAGRL